MKARLPVVLASADNMALSTTTVWVPCSLVPGEMYRLRALVEGVERTQENAALVRLEMPGFTELPPGRGVSHSDNVGPYLYLRTGPNTSRTDRFFTVSAPVHRIGVMAWSSRGPAELRSLTVERVEENLPTSFFLSFDVEALPLRAPGDLIESLVWGRVGGGEYGIGRICSILEQHGLVGNFLVDFASCGAEGDAAERRIVDFLAERGHEVHLHLHSERLAQLWGLKAVDGKSIFLDTTTYDLARRMLEFTITRYERAVGKPARLFRAGGYKTNSDLVLAAGALGIEALSNFRDGLTGDQGEGAVGGEPFVWENGVLEIPVDASSPEASTFENFLGKYEAVALRKTVERTFNMVMHSWSLTKRSPTGFQDTHSPEYEERFHRICDHVRANGQAHGYSAYLDQNPRTRPEVRVGDVWVAQPARQVVVATEGAAMVGCGICRAVFSRRMMVDGACPSCRSTPAARQLWSVVDEYGDLFAEREVLAVRLGPAEQRELLGRASRTDIVVDWPVAGQPDASTDCVLGLDLTAGDADVADSIAEAVRVLRPAGLLVLTASPTAAPEELGELLAKQLTVAAVPALDPATGAVSRIYLAHKATAF
ncbi:hypothetical protein AB0M47_25675 [Hamadaea sp. NPDC051192]|uniref:hypothetical protein n=1 Tax=Hamadaea sp. NPDC051192 TaxID=3154940 RepID=UPI003443FB10